MKQFPKGCTPISADKECHIGVSKRSGPHRSWIEDVHEQMDKFKMKIMIEQFKAGEILQLKTNPEVKLKFIGMDDDRLVVKHFCLGQPTYRVIMTESEKGILDKYELPKKEMYVNLYQVHFVPNTVNGSTYTTKEEALARRHECSPDFLGTFKLEKV